MLTVLYVFILNINRNYLNSLKHNENILGVYLFGSYAKGKQKETSDIDLCIFTKEGIELHDIEVLGREEGFDIHLFDRLLLMIS